MGEETILQLTERHVREGEDHVRRQQVVIATLERCGSTNVDLAHALLVTMQRTLALAREHLELEQRGAPGG
jgi:hypothetical protein